MSSQEAMDGSGARYAAALHAWLGRQLGQTSLPAGGTRQGSLFDLAAYNEEAPAIRSLDELDAALEHLEFAAFRRFSNQLNRAELSRLENTVRNTSFKIERFLTRLPDGPERLAAQKRFAAIRDQVQVSRAQADHARQRARRAELKLAQLQNLSAEGFEDFVGELFEALGFDVKQVGGSGDQGADLTLSRDNLRAVVQCKYYRSQGLVGSPELQKFLGTIHHFRCHHGYFVTTSTFTLSAERFAADHPIDLVDGPRLVDLVREALGGSRRRKPAPLLPLDDSEHDACDDPDTASASELA